MTGSLRTLSRLFARTALILVAALVVAGGSAGIVRSLPQRSVQARNERRPEQARLRREGPLRDRRAASLTRGLPALAVQWLLLGAIAWGGRRFLHLRLKE